MPKICKEHECSHLVFSKGMCKRHWAQNYSKSINPISQKRKGQLLEYKKKRDEFLKGHTLCEIGYDHFCEKIASEVHHTKGKENDLLLDETLWKSVCRHCHTMITEHSAEAIDKGYSVSRHNIKKADLRKGQP